MAFRLTGVWIVLSLMLGPVMGKRGASLYGQVSPGPLARAHAELEGTLKCTKCHGGGKDAMPARCNDCHKDIGWLIAQARGYHSRSDVRTQSCASCHPEHAGVDFKLVHWPEGSPERFDHGRTGWELKQSHADLDCEKCHASKFRTSPAARLSARKTSAGWTGLESNCTSCHEDIHRGALNQDCAICHDAGRWAKTPGFNHDTTSFLLADKHATVRCEQCHLAPRLTPKRDGQGHPVPVYKPVSHERCTDCHTDVHKAQFGTTCTKCHSTRGWKQIDRDNFDHEKTKYPLRGKHAGVRCAACHQDFSTTLLKQPPFETCGACHKDQHKGTATLAGRVVDCDKCHAVNGFSPSSFTVDQHRNTKYVLEGKHQAVKCAQCHRKDSSTDAVTKWGDAKVVIRPAFMRCIDCHADDHGGQLSARSNRGECADCHRVTGWRPSTFDRLAHAKLKLGLDGRHAEIDCRACHGADRKSLPPLPRTALGKANFLFKVTESECTACHVDPHRGRFASGGAQAKDRGCLACHDTKAFKPSTAGITSHKDFGLALEGGHGATPCVSCHADMKPSAVGSKRSSLIAGGATFTELRFEAKTACADCHENPHGDQFSSRKDRGRCDACHTAEAFRPAGLFDHNRDAAFSLKGAHEKVPCNRCHSTDVSAGHAERLIFRPLSGKCESCHGGKETR